MIARWRVDVFLALRLARAGGRKDVVRVLLAATGIGLCLFVLLLLGSVSPAIQHRSERLSEPVLTHPTGTFRWHDATVTVDGQTATGTALAALSANPAPPPGIAGWPQPGQVYVSPALAQRVRSDTRWAQQLGATIVGTIDPAVLPGPADLTFYLGVRNLPRGDNNYPIVGGSGDRWRPALAEYGLGRRLSTVLVAGGTVLVVSLLLFVALAGRLGGAARDRRLAAIRLLGAGPERLRRIGTVDAAVTGLVGVALGWIGFVSIRRLGPRLSVDGHGFAPGDIWPGTVYAAALTAVVLAVAVQPALIGSRRRLVEPLGVVRRPAARPKGGWRLAFVLLSVLVAAVSTIGLLSAFSGWFVPTVAPAVLLLCCVPVTLPWLLDRLSRRWIAGGPALRLAIGRIQQDPITAARSAGGVALALAGAIAMVTLISLGNVLQPAGDIQSDGSVLSEGQVEVSTVADLAGVREQLRQVAGLGELTVFIGIRPDVIHVADCATLRTVADIPTCVDGDIFRVSQPSTSVDSTPAVGEAVATSDDADGPGWTVPATVVEVRAKHFPGIWMTPAAYLRELPTVASGPQTIHLMAALPESAAPAARDALAPYGWRAAGSFAPPGGTVGGVLGLVVPGLIIGSLLGLVVCALGQFVITAEMVTERRRSLALAAAAGVPRQLLIRAQVWGAAIPIAVGAVIAVAFGSFLANVLLRQFASPLGVAGRSAGWMAAVAIGFVVLVALATVPMLRRATRPSGLRTE